MNTHQEQIGTTPPQGNLLRLSERREIAIYLREGAAWVADFNNGRVEFSIASAWCSMGGGGGMLAHALRRGEIEIVSPLPDEVVQRIESLHRRMEKPTVGPAVRRALAALVAGFRHRALPVQPY